MPAKSSNSRENEEHFGLKPCPFCGEQPSHFYENPFIAPSIECEKCNFRFRGEFHAGKNFREPENKKLVNRWNKRFNECEH